MSSPGQKNIVNSRKHRFLTNNSQIFVQVGKQEEAWKVAYTKPSKIPFLLHTYYHSSQSIYGNQMKHSELPNQLEAAVDTSCTAQVDFAVD
ncbi:hypothetical protein QQP08_023750 [Theobroma cacao]|nr:hypothetical protein QQP08_023750 [Theobroma cacao]